MAQFTSIVADAGHWISADPFAALGLCALVGLATMWTAARKE
jgi:hypothetical protein